MTGRRRKDHHLPLRVYFIRGRHIYVDHNGKQHTLGKEWDRAAKDRWLELSEGRAAAYTVADLLDRYLKHVEQLVRAKKRSARTLEDNETEAKVLKLVLGRTPATAVTSKHVATYLVRRTDKDGKPAPIRANREIALLSSAYSWGMRLEDWGIERNPCYGVRRNEETPRRDYVASRNLVMFGKRETTPEWLRGYAVLKRLTGLRQGDLLALTQANITARGIEIETSKTGKRLRFGWTWALRIVVKWIKTHQPSKAEALCLFPNTHGSALQGSGLKTYWNRAMTAHVAAGGVWIRENDIRAKTASDSRTLGEAQERLGHASASTTKRVYQRGVSKVTPLR